MASSTNAPILIFLIVLLILVSTVGVIYKIYRPRHLELEVIVSNEPNLTTPLLGPWRNSWTNSWSNSWINSWGWLRRDKHDQLLPTSHPTSMPPLVTPQPTTEDTAPSAEVTPAERSFRYTVLSSDLARAVPKASPSYLDGLTIKKTIPWNRHVLSDRRKKTTRSRKSQSARGRSISPYRPSSECHHSQPIAIISKENRRPRPAFPLPEKMIWKKLTPYEKAGMVWYRNAAY